MKFDPSNYTILIVDDVETNVLLLKLLISKVGFKIFTASNGVEALKITSKEKIDLMLLDIMMPLMDGMEVAQKIKEMEPKQRVPFFFLSALTSTEDIVKGFKMGAVDYLSKPFNKEELLTRINHQISLIDAKKTIEEQNRLLKRTIIEKDKLYSVIAHDLRSPIASIRMVTEVLIDGIDRESISPDMYDLLVMANKLTDDSFNLLDNLLKWTKKLTGTLHTVIQDNVSIMHLIQGVLEVMRGVAKLKGISINLNGETDRSASIDIDMAKTTLRNLLSNAIKYSYPNSSIDVNIVEESDKILIEIEDWGVGISKERQEELLKSDFNISTLGTKNEEGSGLGLLLSYEFAKRNGGSLKFHSVEGEGSLFSFDIPTPQK
ncbi:MAG: hybrid sensor histidine kinase/response regulator [Bacteroidales bacterium]